MIASGAELIVSVNSAGQIDAVQPPPYHVLIDRALRGRGRELPLSAGRRLHHGRPGASEPCRCGPHGPRPAGAPRRDLDQRRVCSPCLE
jgi:hypothetical protein